MLGFDALEVEDVASARTLDFCDSFFCGSANSELDDLEVPAVELTEEELAECDRLVSLGLLPF